MPRKSIGVAIVSRSPARTSNGPTRCSNQLEQVLRVGAAQQRVEEPAVDEPVLAACRLDVGGRAGRRARECKVERDPDARVRTARAQSAGRPSRARPAGDARPAGPSASPGRPGALRAFGVPAEGDAPRLVVGDPVGDDDPRARRPRGARSRRTGAHVSRAAQPPASCNPAGRSAVVERHDRLDPALAQPGREPPVEVDALAVERAAPVRLHPRPADREAVGLQASSRDQVEILAPAVVVVAGDVAGRAVRDRAGTGEAIPDRLAAAVLGDRALDLIAPRTRPRTGTPAGTPAPRSRREDAAIQTSGAFQRMQTSFVVSDVGSSR